MLREETLDDFNLFKFIDLLCGLVYVSLGEYSMYIWEKHAYYDVVGWSVLQMFVWSSWFIMLFKTYISLLIDHCLLTHGCGPVLSERHVGDSGGLHHPPSLPPWRLALSRFSPECLLFSIFWGFTKSPPRSSLYPANAQSRELGKAVIRATAWLEAEASSCHLKDRFSWLGWDEVHLLSLHHLPRL